MEDCCPKGGSLFLYPCRYTLSKFLFFLYSRARRSDMKTSGSLDRRYGGAVREMMFFWYAQKKAIRLRCRYRIKNDLAHSRDRQCEDQTAYSPKISEEYQGEDGNQWIDTDL